MLFFNMLMSKQMLHTILIISITFGTKSKLKLIIIMLCLTTCRAFVSGNNMMSINGGMMTKIHTRFHLFSKLGFTFIFSWGYSSIISCCKEENQEIGHGYY